MKWRIWLADNLVILFRRLGMFGATRFRITRACYKLFWSTGPRNGEWEFVLNYLPNLEPCYRKSLRVLDVGCTESLLVYELHKRGYNTHGLDQRKYQERLPKEIKFYRKDITNLTPIETVGNKLFDFVLALSTIEHVGMGGYGDKRKNGGDRLALENIHNLLLDHGFFIITVPLYYWASDVGRGYTYESFGSLIKGLFDVCEITQRNGQICALLVKSQRNL
jgi:SAM-dependent methyltransferase